MASYISQYSHWHNWIWHCNSAVRRSIHSPHPPFVFFKAKDPSTKTSQSKKRQGMIYINQLRQRWGNCLVSWVLLFSDDSWLVRLELNSHSSGTVGPYSGVLHCLSAIILWSLWATSTKPRSHAAKEKVAHRSRDPACTGPEICWSAAQMTFPSVEQKWILQITWTFLYRNMPESVALPLRLSVYAQSRPSTLDCRAPSRPLRLWLLMGAWVLSVQMHRS